MWTSFCSSDSSSRVTGTPVHRLTTSATSSASTSSFSMAPSACRSARAWVAISMRRSMSGIWP